MTWNHCREKSECEAKNLTDETHHIRHYDWWCWKSTRYGCMQMIRKSGESLGIITAVINAIIFFDRVHNQKGAVLRRGGVSQINAKKKKLLRRGGNHSHFFLRKAKEELTRFHRITTTTEDVRCCQIRYYIKVDVRICCFASFWWQYDCCNHLWWRIKSTAWADYISITSVFNKILSIALAIWAIHLSSKFFSGAHIEFKLEDETCFVNVGSHCRLQDWTLSCWCKGIITCIPHYGLNHQKDLSQQGSFLEYE